jgi:hypothetical protein
MEFRLCLHFLPTIICAGVVALVSLVPWTYLNCGVLTVIILGMCLSPVRLETSYYMQSLEEMARYVADGTQVGQALRSLPRDTRIATTLIGTVGFYSELPIVDQWGLVDRSVRERQPRQTFVRGHVVFTTASEAAGAGADLYFAHPDVDECRREYLNNEYELLMRLADSRCVRALVMTADDDLRRWICSQPGTFAVVGAAVCDL